MEKVIFVAEGKPVCARLAGFGLDCHLGYIYLGPGRDFVYADRGIGAGDFRIHARLSLHKPPEYQGFVQIPKVHESNAAFCFAGGDFCSDEENELKVSGFVPPEIRRHSRFGFGHEGRIYVDGSLFGKLELLGVAKSLIPMERPFDFEVVRIGSCLRFLLDGKVAYETTFDQKIFGKVGFTAGQGVMRLRNFEAQGNTYDLDWQRSQLVGYTVPVIDLADQQQRQVVVAKGSESIDYQHPTTVLLQDGRTILCPWTHGHGGALGPMKRSPDGGLTWQWVKTPEDWTEVQNCPTIHRLTDGNDVERLIVLGGKNGSMMQAISEDLGVTWSAMRPTGLSCTVPPITIEPISDGRHLALFHQGRSIFMSVTENGGLTWSKQQKIAAERDAYLCEPVIIRSPNGKQLATVMRENSRWYNSFIMFSNDEGATWSNPEELPGSMSGDRHAAGYDEDGRIVMVFRDSCICSKTAADFVGWVGTYEDLVEKREGQYRVRLIANSRYASAGYTGYPGLERLADGTFVATTYAVIEKGHRASIVSVRFRLSETDGSTPDNEGTTV